MLTSNNNSSDNLRQRSAPPPDPHRSRSSNNLEEEEEGQENMQRSNSVGRSRSSSANSSDSGLYGSEPDLIAERTALRFGEENELTEGIRESTTEEGLEVSRRRIFSCSSEFHFSNYNSKQRQTTANLIDSIEETNLVSPHNNDLNTTTTGTHTIGTHTTGGTITSSSSSKATVSGSCNTTSSCASSSASSSSTNQNLNMVINIEEDRNFNRNFNTSSDLGDIFGLVDHNINPDELRQKGRDSQEYEQEEDDDPINIRESACLAQPYDQYEDNQRTSGVIDSDELQLLEDNNYFQLIQSSSESESALLSSALSSSAAYSSVPGLGFGSDINPSASATHRSPLAIHGRPRVSFRNNVNEGQVELNLGSGRRDRNQEDRNTINSNPNSNPPIRNTRSRQSNQTNRRGSDTASNTNTNRNQDAIDTVLARLAPAATVGVGAGLGAIASLPLPEVNSSTGHVASVVNRMQEFTSKYPGFNVLQANH